MSYMDMRLVFTSLEILVGQSMPYLPDCFENIIMNMSIFSKICIYNKMQLSWIQTDANGLRLVEEDDPSIVLAVATNGNLSSQHCKQADLQSQSKS